MQQRDSAMKTHQNMDHLHAALRERILILDGAMGTMLQKQGLTESDFRGTRFQSLEKELRGNNDVLCLTCPEAVRKVHDAYLEAGADIIETNTFNSNAVSQADYGLQDLVYELNRAGAQVARQAADAWTGQTPEKPRFVAGSIGPTGRTASLSPDVANPALRNVTFDELAATYRIAAAGLIDGGADILLIETVFDTLNCKAAIYGIESTLRERGMRMPVMISGTVSDASGRMLAGQNVEAFLISVSHTPDLLSIGFNCALGASEMRPHIAELAAKAPFFVSAHPNAGLPDELGHYSQTPEIMGSILREFAESHLLNIVGGCCGTTPAHIKAIAEAVRGIPPRRVPEVKKYFRLSGLDPLVVTENTNFVNIGERTNVAGSKKFLNLIRNGDYEAAVHIARSQIENGAQIIDVNMDDAMLDSPEAMRLFLLSVAGEPDIARVPVMIDSSRWEVIEAGLKCVQGKCAVNSISLKEGEEAFLEKARGIRRYGGAALVMAFDENGQADTLARRIAVCERSFRLLTEKANFPPEDIIFDPNVFAVATGMKEHDNYARDFIDAVGAIRKAMPLCRISGGVSNVSFAFRGNNTVREALHSVFLYHAIRNGMDMGIVNPGQLAVYEELPADLREAAEDVILNRRPDAAERLIEIAAHCSADASAQAKSASPDWRNEPLSARIAHAMLKGDDAFIEADMDEALGAFADPVDIIEGPLMAAMKQVGTLFGEGKMFLPQVVKSARVMKKAVGKLLPVIEARKGASGTASSGGTIVIATVKGDVHDIGKNIAGVVLQCNNYRIVDLGVMVPMQTILDAAEKEKADLIGLSGLITPSLDEMVAIAKEMERRGMKIPLLLGGATTSRAHTALKVQPCYSGPVVHASDASQGVLLVNALLNPETRETFLENLKEEYAAVRAEAEEKHAPLLPLAEARANALRSDWETIPDEAPVHPGITDFPEEKTDALLPYVDWKMFLNTWELEHADAASREALLRDARAMLDSMRNGSLLRCSGSAGLYPAASDGDDIEIYSDPSCGECLAKLPMLRQQWKKSAGNNLSLADYLPQKRSGRHGWTGVFAVTCDGAEALAKRYAGHNDDYSALLVKTLADRLAEAFAELLFERVRRELWGYERTASPDGRIRGIRPAPGYPAAPDHRLKAEIFRLLGVERKFGMELTGSYMMRPAASVCGMYFSHPEARYFSVGRIGDDQLADYAARSGATPGDVTRFLSFVR